MPDHKTAYHVPFANMADMKVFPIGVEHQADLTISWAESEAEAEVKVFFVPVQQEADATVFIQD